jgi:hypothetical protein
LRELNILLKFFRRKSLTHFFSSSSISLLFPSLPLSTHHCNSLNIYVSPNAYVEILAHKVIVLGGVAFGRY